MQNLVLIGMPGSGKTSVAEALGRMTGRKVLDLDDLFTATYGITPAQCITGEGEPEVFRLYIGAASPHREDGMARRAAELLISVEEEKEGNR